MIDPQIIETLQRAELTLQTRPDETILRRHLAISYLKVADQIFEMTINSNRPDDLLRSIEWYDRAFALKASNIDQQYIEAFFRAANPYQILGRLAEAKKYINKALKLKEKVASKQPLTAQNIRILATRSGVLTNIGHIMSEPEIAVKRRELGLIQQFRLAMFAQTGSCVNQCGLDYWRQYITAITEPRLIKRLAHLASTLELNNFWFEANEGKLLSHWDGMLAVEKSWEDCGKQPLLKLFDEHRQRAWGILKNGGITENDWFVALHVRDESFSKDKPRPALADEDSRRDRIRDASIANYIPAIEEITKRGGWVIRIGDPRMEPLPRMEGVIDLSVLNQRVDFLDIFVGAAARFFLSTASGPAQLATSFGVPMVCTNIAPGVSQPPSNRDLFIPKLVRNLIGGNLLSFSDVFGAPLAYTYHGKVFANLNLDVIENSAEDIFDVTCEMLDRLDGRVSYSSTDQELQHQFGNLVGKFRPCQPNSRIGTKFLAKYKHLL